MMAEFENPQLSLDTTIGCRFLSAFLSPSVSFAVFTVSFFVSCGPPPTPQGSRTQRAGETMPAAQTLNPKP